MICDSFFLLLIYDLCFNGIPSCTVNKPNPQVSLEGYSKSARQFFVINHQWITLLSNDSDSRCYSASKNLVFIYLPQSSILFGKLYDMGNSNMTGKICHPVVNSQLLWHNAQIPENQKADDTVCAINIGGLDNRLSTSAARRPNAKLNVRGIIHRPNKRNKIFRS